MKGQTLFSVRKSLLTFETAQFVPNLFLANLEVFLVPDVSIETSMDKYVVQSDFTKTSQFVHFCSAAPLLRIIGRDFCFELIEPQIRVRDRVEGWEWWRIIIPQSGRFISSWKHFLRLMPMRSVRLDGILLNCDNQNVYWVR